MVKLIKNASQSKETYKIWHFKIQKHKVLQSTCKDFIIFV